MDDFQVSIQNEPSTILPPSHLSSDSINPEEGQRDIFSDTALTNLNSESSKPQSPEEEDQEDISLDEASIVALDPLKSQTTTMVEAYKLVAEQWRDQFKNRLLQLIDETEFEFGFSTPADKHVNEALNSYGPFAREWINDLFIESFDTPFVLSAILRVIAHFDYQQMNPQGITMAVAATVHTDPYVRECGLRCFESWESSESLKILRNLSFSEDWLSEYLAAVISDLEGVEKHGVCR